MDQFSSAIVSSQQTDSPVGELERKRNDVKKKKHRYLRLFFLFSLISSSSSPSILSLLSSFPSVFFLPLSLS